MSRVRMEITGFDDIMGSLDGMGDKAQSVEVEALQAGGEVIKRHQISNWNRSTKKQEHIEDNIVIGRAKDVAEGTQVKVAPKGSLLFRAKFVEYGTSKMAAQSPIERSGIQGEAESQQKMMKVFESVIKL